jgi:hypothetical protein
MDRKAIRGLPVLQLEPANEENVTYGRKKYNIKGRQIGRPFILLPTLFILWGGSLPQAMEGNGKA